MDWTVEKNEACENAPTATTVLQLERRPHGAMVLPVVGLPGLRPCREYVIIHGVILGSVASAIEGP